MAKGDRKKVQNVIDYQVPKTEQAIDKQQEETGARTSEFQSNYGPAVEQSKQDYGNIMGNYQGFLGRMPNTGSNLSTFLGPRYSPEETAATGRNAISDVNSFYDFKSSYGDFRPTDYGALGPAVGGYGKMASTGGFSPEDIQNIRARAIAPIRSIYDSARRETSRAGAINPQLTNVGASQAKLAREMSYALADKSTDVEAMLADSIRSGKLSGLSGLANVGLGTFGPSLNASLGARGQDLSTMLGTRGQDLNAILGGGGLSLEGMRGMTGLYGTTPGMANMFGNQVLQSGAQGIDLTGMRGGLANSAINAQLGASQLPSNFQQAMGNIGSAVGLGSQVAGAFMGLPTSGARPPLPSIPTTPNMGWMPTGGTGIRW